uniref:Protein ALP1-like n=1 Tax=Tanacetum cinerariifolium TaxID=118510 RepID=A0A6L2KTK7_TANCI|nr:hypothetical protein [Tanacetum cinerariifolium]
MSISALMKCTAAIRQFAYGSTADAFDEYLQMSEHTARDALFFFNMCIIELYMPKYLRKPTSEDVIQQKHNNVHGFSGMLKNIDCMHWEWKNCQMSWQDNSPLFDDLLDDLAHVVPYVVNGVEYRNGYYLADGIYPEWESFVKSFTVATNPKHMRKCGLINYKSLLEPMFAPPQMMRGKSVVSLSDASTNKALQVAKDPPCLQSLLNGEHERLASIHRAITELVYLIEARHHLNPVFIPKHDSPRIINDGEVMLVIESRGIPLRFGEVQLNLVALNPKLEVFYPLSDNQMFGPLVDGRSKNLLVFRWEVVQVTLKV